MGLHLDDYHQAVKDYVLSECAFLNSVEDYPEEGDMVAGPCAFFGVVDWDRSEDQRMNGELSVVLNCQLLILFGQAGQVSSRSVRNAAMAVALKVDEQRFGLDVEPAQFISAGPWAFDPNFDQYVVWAVNFSHVVEVGEDQFDLMPDFLPTDVRVGIAPDIGVDNLDAYEQVGQ